MEFKELVSDRRSIRKFLSEPISRGDITEIIQTATNACNSGNEQNWRFIIIENETVKNKMAEVVRNKAVELINDVIKVNPAEKPSYAPQEFFLEAPVIIGVATTSKYWSKPDLMMLETGYTEEEVADLRCRGDLQTVGAAIQLILLAAWEKGLGGCWMTGPLFARKELEKLLGITDGEALAAFIPIGKPAILPTKRGRKPVEEVISFIE